MKKKLHQWHSISALIAMIPLFLICLTGSILVFKVEIDTLLMPESMKISANSPIERLPLDKLMSQVKAQYLHYEIGSWEIFDDKRRTDTAYLIKHNTTEWHKLYINQYTGELLSKPVGLSEDLTDWLLDLHYKLLLDTNGMFLGAIVSLLLLFLGISGMVLYRKFWLYFFTLRFKQANRIFFSDLHKLVGISSAPVLLILAFTGAYWNIGEVVHEVSEHIVEEPYYISAPLHNSSLSIQSLYESTPDVISGFSASYLVMPYEPGVNITFYGKIKTNNPLNSDYSSSITFDKDSGNLLRQLDIRTSSNLHVVVDSFRKLHFGHFGGLTSKVIWCVLGLSPIILSLTGLYLYWFKRRRKSVTVTKPRVAEGLLAKSDF